MNPEEGNDQIAADTADTDFDEDQSFDNLEDAVNALADDEEAETEPTDDGEPVEEEPEEPEDPDLAEFDFNDGKVTLKELKDGYLRQKDYTAKTTEVSNQRKALQAQAETVNSQARNLESAVEAIAEYLQAALGAEPSFELLNKNPQEYLRQKATREAAAGEIARLMQAKEAARQASEAISDADTKAYRMQEADRLIAVMPQLRDPAKRATFDARVANAAKALGFTADEIAQTADHRVLRMVHYAALGMSAQKNQQAAVKKAAEAPKSQKARPSAAPVDVGQKIAMSRFVKSGSLRDAAKLDFE